MVSGILVVAVRAFLPLQKNGMSGEKDCREQKYRKNLRRKDLCCPGKQKQEKQDQIEDSLNKKEYVDPFKGSK